VRVDEILMRQIVWKKWKNRASYGDPEHDDSLPEETSGKHVEVGQELRDIGVV
jgi:hypothetical protein